MSTSSYHDWFFQLVWAGPNSSLQFLTVFPCFTSLRSQESHGMQDLMSCRAAVVAARSLQIELLVPEFWGLLAWSDLLTQTEALRLRLDKKLRVGSMDQCIILGHLCQVFRCSGVQVMTPRMIEKFRVYYLGANLSMREANNLPTTSTCKHQWDHCNLTAGQTPQNVGDTTLGRTLDSPFAVLLESLVEVSPKAKQTFQKFPNMCLLS